MKQKYNVIISFQAEAKKEALSELLIADGKAMLKSELSEEAALIDTTLPFEKIATILQKLKPIFIRHIQPVHITFPLENDNMLDAINEQFLGIMNQMVQKDSFSVQTRVIGNVGLKPFDINGLLSKTAVDAGYTLDISSPAQAVSVLLFENTLFMGISYCKDNLSNWAGGRRRFAKTDEQLSRAEFKLLEALETFDVSIPTGAVALDLGAAPGGWSRVLLEKGAHVTAVDPASVDDSIKSNGNLRTIKTTAQEFLTFNDQHFDFIVNDMRMDAEESARLMCSYHPYLKEGGIMIITLKLHDKKMRATSLKAIRILENVYTLLGARQLFHNRSEISVAVKK